ncbi:hypothetical protein TorRG33x02_109450, partial [Trema orientale]
VDEILVVGHFPEPPPFGWTPKGDVHFLKPPPFGWNPKGDVEARTFDLTFSKCEKALR